MGYPETAEGFMIEDPKKWSTFKKQEVKLRSSKVAVKRTPNSCFSSNSSLSRTMTSISQLTRAVFAAAMFTQLLEDGVKSPYQFV